MTEEGETPEAGSDRDEEERSAAADGDDHAVDGDPSAAEGDETTPAGEDEREAGEPGRDTTEVDRDVEPGPADGKSAEDELGEDDADSVLPGEVPHTDEEARPDEGSRGDELDAGDVGEWEAPETPEDATDAPRERTGSEREGRRDVESGRDHEALESDTDEAESADGTPDGSESINADAWSARDEGTATSERTATGEGTTGGEVGEPENEVRPGEGAPGVPSEFEGAESVDGAGTTEGDDGPGTADGAGATEEPGETSESEVAAEPDVPEDVRSYDRFQKVDRASYDRVNEFLRDRTYVTAREWAIARLCADFRTATGVEMTKIGENLPHLVPFMTDTYSPQAVNQARSAFEDKVRKSGATFLYGAMSGFFTADELDDIMYEITEVAKFLLEVEGVELTVDEELDAEDRISAVMREVRQASEELRYDEVACPHCGEAFRPAEE